MHGEILMPAAYAENNNIAIKYIGEPDATQAPDASAAPSASPSADVKPTQTPTKAPTQQPTQSPTQTPTQQPTQAPTQTPSATKEPAEDATPIPQEPTQAPTAEPPTYTATSSPMPQSPTEIPLVQPIGNENKPSVSVGYQYTYKGMVYTVSSTENEQTVICSSFDNKKASKVVIPATINIEGTVYKVTAIADNAYKGCSKLKKITIGKNVVKIGKNCLCRMQ